MGKAEVGSTRYLNNKMKSKGLQRLRWFCQVCERQMRDENGFKMHTQSESHVRQMMLVGEDPKKFINEYSRQFQRDFLQLLRTGHGEKQVQINHFYQEYIANKEHVHMNSTKWPSLTEFAKHLGREGLCRVEENDKGIHIAWIDDSPEALRRKEAVKRKEMQDKGDEEREQRMIREQVKRAQREAAKKQAGGADREDDEDEEELALKRGEGEKIKLSFGAKPAASTNPALSPDKEDEPTLELAGTTEVPVPEKPTVAPVSMKMTAKPQPKNVFATAKKNALAGGAKKPSPFQQPRKMSEAERIMKEEMEKTKKRSGPGFNFGSSNKKQRTD
ncbi:domain of Kin17 curved DNA-binding protein-domain-containing protein [Pseudomassariella vexata]|uniref:Domain of Kin17 curved DNA-binding protein-domain-containing protein n=1 Tax=Pseudomassariella vexata TaxID=1141098 RepID=A0A1Y2EKU9_9PEZI|nr:domain of Kin17 curved DNA-binding protein-domain-containing protein [Pseudomassariella vexata]ORY71926.1 domain of Kin17 curved DNA-binding protein-domain-containing protein [Pseudomassariella vexata]